MSNPVFWNIRRGVRRLVELLKARRGKRRSSRSAGGRRGPRRRNPWRKCPACYRRVPKLCQTVEDGHPCGFGPCCCPGHEKRRPESGDGQVGGKFTFSVER